MAKSDHGESRSEPSVPGRSFWCFISYRHSDNATKGREWATWLHRELETYDVPKELVGQVNEWGVAIPDRIYPVFRDEEELPAFADLSTAIVQALEQSRSLIVICSPAAKQSKFVNEEVARFKSLGRDDRVCGMVVRGEPDIRAPACCLPLPLVRRVGTDATVSMVAVEPLLVDMRDPSGAEEWQDFSARIASLVSSGLSPSLARQKAAEREEKLQESKLFLVSWVLGVSFQTLRDAHERRLRSMRRGRYLVVGFWAATALAGIALTGFGVRAASGIRQQASTSADNAERARISADKAMQEAAVKEAEATKARLASLYAEAIGLGQAQRWQEAVVLLRQASDGGHHAAKVELAKLLAAGRGVKADRPEAIRLLEAVVTVGDLPAQALLGRLLLASESDDEIRSRGVSLLRECLRRGDLSVRLELAKALATSRPADAIALLRDEAVAGPPEASWLLGTLLKQSARQSDLAPEWYGWWLKAADSGWIPAKRDAGHAFWAGLVGPVSSFNSVERRAALRRLIESAHAGDQAASESLVALFENPTNYPADPQEAQEFMTEGARAGVVKAAFGLAEILAARAETPDDANFLSAMEWYGRAKQSGMLERALLRQGALMMRVAAARNNSENKQVISAALRNFTEVAETGGVEGMLGAAEAVQLLGGPGSSAEAEVWLRKAEATGDSRARRMLAAWIIRSGKDGREASELLREGMAHRDGEAALQLGDWMASHARTKEQLSKTFEAYVSGADFGNGTCALKAATMLRKGKGVATDVRRAERLELRAAQCGQPQAMLDRGRLLLESGDAKVLPEAYAWLSEAAVNGKSLECAQYLAKIELLLTDSQRAAASGLAKQIKRGIADATKGP